MPFTPSTELDLGEAVGQLYVEKYFPPEAKQRMLDLVENSKTVFRDHLKNASWMSVCDAQTGDGEVLRGSRRRSATRTSFGIIPRITIKRDDLSGAIAAPGCDAFLREHRRDRPGRQAGGQERSGT